METSQIIISAKLECFYELFEELIDTLREKELRVVSSLPDQPNTEAAVSGYFLAKFDNIFRCNSIFWDNPPLEELQVIISGIFDSENDAVATKDLFKRLIETLNKSKNCLTKSWTKRQHFLEEFYEFSLN